MVARAVGEAETVVLVVETSEARSKGTSWTERLSGPLVGTPQALRATAAITAPISALGPALMRAPPAARPRSAPPGHRNRPPPTPCRRAGGRARPPVTGRGPIRRLRNPVAGRRRSPGRSARRPSAAPPP